MMHGSPNSYASCTPVTKSDSVIQNYAAFFAIGAGNLVVKDLAGNTLTFTALPIYTIIPVAISQVMSTNTTSTGIFGLN